MGWLRGQFAPLRLDIKRIMAEADLGVTHSNLHLEPGDRGLAVADFWRLADGKIVEHWDVIQQVPEKSPTPTVDRTIGSRTVLPAGDYRPCDRSGRRV